MGHRMMVQRSRVRGLEQAPARFDDGRLLRLLGLPPSAADPVGIITAAQIRLRRWRHFDARGLDAGQARRRIQLITEARDLLLRRQESAALLTRDRAS